MAVDVTVLRRVVKKDYFQQGTGAAGYVNVGGTVPPIHRELAYLLGDTDITDKNVVIVFNKPFVNFPVGIGNFKLYRYEAQGAGFSITPVLYTVPSVEWLTLIGFEINIAEFESLTGLIFEYNFTE